MRAFPLLRAAAVALALGASPAWAHAVTLGAFSGSASASFNGTPGWLGAEVAYTWDAARWAAQGGVRVAMPFDASPVPLEAFARFLLAAGYGAWRPLVGPELGVSGLAVLEAPLARRPTELHAAEQRTLGPAYVAMHAAPVRFVFRERWVVSALELQVGTSLAAPGATVRTQLQLLAAGVRW